MAPPDDAILAELSTTPIFDDAVYCIEALQLAEHEFEDRLEERLADTARQLGVHPVAFLSPAPEPELDVSDRMSAMNVARELELRVFASPRLREPASPPVSPGAPSPRSPVSPALDRSYLSLDECGPALDWRPCTRHRHSDSTTSGSVSAFSMSSAASQEAKPKRHRMSSLFRREPRGVGSPGSPISGAVATPQPPSRAQQARLQRGSAPAIFGVPVRNQYALDSGLDLPWDYGRPLPKPLEPIVHSKADSVVTDEANNCRPHDRGSDLAGEPASSIALRPTARLPPAGCVLGPQDEESARVAMDDHRFRAMQLEQREEYTRIVVFEKRQRRALAVFKQRSLKAIADQLESTKAAAVTQHAEDLEQLEEAQVHAEHELHRAHAQEIQNANTALRHMEAYCRGPDPVSTEPRHHATEDDVRKLRQQRTLRAELPNKHTSAIGVLRARQEQETKTRTAKQRAELTRFANDAAARCAHTDDFVAREAARLDALIAARRRRAARRWALRREIWCKRFDAAHPLAAPLLGRLPDDPVWAAVEADVAPDVELEGRALAVYAAA